jgi:ribose-phosphate pyrophosphokinase
VNGLKGTKKVILNKYRPKPNFAEHLSVDSSEIKGKVCVIIDDIIDTGGTIISAAEMLLNNGAKEVLVGASHGVFSHGSLDKLISSPITDIAVTNSIEKKLSNKVNVLDISKLINY